VAVEKEVSLNSGTKILLTGDVSKAFLDIGSISETSCKVCTELPDAIDAASKSSFAAIAVVMSGNTVKLSSTLKILRNISNAKVILLAQMYEEPIAIRLVGSTYNGLSLADDYLVCPVRADEFSRLLIGPQNGRAAEITTTAAFDTTIEMRIKHLEKLATEDDLTGLKNRRYIWEFSRQIIEHARGENKRVTLLVFDIDDLKHYNDLCGHSAGDEILKQAGALMRRCCRSHDVVGRIGGDEFAVIFWDDPSISDSSIEQTAKNERRSATADHPNEAISIARRFVRELENAHTSLGDISGGGLGSEGKGVLTISGGLASFPRDGSTAQELFEQADKALLEAKRSGKNRIYLVGSPKKSASSVELSD